MTKSKPDLHPVERRKLRTTNEHLMSAHYDLACAAARLEEIARGDLYAVTHRLFEETLELQQRIATLLGEE